MPTPGSTKQVWHFGIYEVDASRVELRRNGSPIKLRDQSFLVLKHLLEHAGEIVTREDLRQILWPSDTFVEFDHSLSTAVMKLRDALGDSTGTPVYIETIPKHGYRFIAKVTAVEQNSALAPISVPISAPISAVIPASVAAPTPAPVAAEPRSRKRTDQLVAGLAAVLLLALVPWIAFHLRTEPAPPAMVQFQILPPDKANFTQWDLAAVSPDGQRIAFTAAGRLFVRSLNAATATEIPIPGFHAAFPFWSPDGQQIAFSFWGNQALQRVNLSGGPPVTICSDCNAFMGGTWNRDGVILSATKTVLFRVSAAGGEAKSLRPLAQGEIAERWPEFLPDGKHYLYLSIGNAPDQQGIYVASLDSNERKFIVASSANVAYLQSGQLLFTRGDVLMAQPFDLQSLKLSGEPRQVADHIESGGANTPIASFAASPNGVIVFRQSAKSSQSSLQWFDRSGKKLGVVGDVAEYSSPELSPDDSKLAICIRDPQTKTRSIWIFDLLRGGKMRLTFNPADNCNPIWSPEGTRIAFTSHLSGQGNIYWKLADGSGPEELLLGGKEGQENVEDWSRDGGFLSYNYTSGHAVLRALPLAGDRKPVTYLDMTRAGFTTTQSRFSPNGQWVAYRSTESGGNEVYVQRFSLDPSQPRGKWQISTAGGETPRWRSDGKELYYHYDHFGTHYFAVDVKTDGPSFEAGIPKPLFDAHAVAAGGNSNYAVTSDGQRFLVTAATDDKPPTEPIDVLVNWR